MDKATQAPEMVSISKDELTKLQESIASLQGLGEVVKSQSETIKTLKDKLETATARIDNTNAAISGKYVQPAKISGGKYPFLSFKANVLYRQANVDGTIGEKEITLDIEMPKPCGKLNSVGSELQNRIIPRLFKKKGIGNYQIADIQYDEEKIKVESKAVSFVGKKVFELTEDECEQFAIIYEGLQVPVNASLATMRQRVAQEWGYVLHDVAYNEQLIVNGRIVDKMQQKIDLVDYAGARQDYPNLEAMSPSKFREVAESAKEDDK